MQADLSCHERGREGLAEWHQAATSHRLPAAERAAALEALQAKVSAELQGASRTHSSVSLSAFMTLLGFAARPSTDAPPEEVGYAMDLFRTRLSDELVAATEEVAASTHRLQDALRVADESLRFLRFGAGEAAVREGNRFMQIRQEAREALELELMRGEAMGALSTAARLPGIERYRGALQHAREVARCPEAQLSAFDFDLAQKETALAALKAKLKAAVVPVAETTRLLTSPEFDALNIAVREANKAGLIHDDDEAWNEGRLAQREANRRLQEDEARRL